MATPPNTTITPKRGSRMRSRLSAGHAVDPQQVVEQEEKQQHGPATRFSSRLNTPRKKVRPAASRQRWANGRFIEIAALGTQNGGLQRHQRQTPGAVVAVKSPAKSYHQPRRTIPIQRVVQEGR